MGLNLRGLRVNADKALVRKPFKPDPGFRADPVPANLASDLIQIKAWSPGSGAPDPKPATPADELTIIQAFKPNVGLCVDPVPARSPN